MWTTLTIWVKRRAGWQCECGGECGQDHGGQRCPVYQTGHQPPGATITDRLAAAHIYRTLETCQQGTDLVALCPACHAAYDKRQHVDTRTVTRDAMAGQTPMFPVPSDLGCEFDLRPPLPDQQALDTTDLELESLPAWAETCRDHVLRARDLAATAGADRGDAYLEGLEAIQVLRTAIEHLEDKGYKAVDIGGRRRCVDRRLNCWRARQFVVSDCFHQPMLTVVAKNVFLPS